MITELTLTESENRYRRLFESAQDGILILDAETGIDRGCQPLSDRNAGLFTYRVHKKKLWEVGHSRILKPVKRLSKRCKRMNISATMICRSKQKNGRADPGGIRQQCLPGGGEKVIQCKFRNIGCT